MRGYLPSCSPKSEAVSVMLKQPLSVTGILLALVPSFTPGLTGKGWIYNTITTLCRFHAQPGTHECIPGSSRNRHTLLLQIVKEQPMRQPKSATSSPVKNQSQQSPLWTCLAMIFGPCSQAIPPPPAAAYRRPRFKDWWR
jgi:hypothetical protein